MVGAAKSGGSVSLPFCRASRTVVGTGAARHGEAGGVGPCRWPQATCKDTGRAAGNVDTEPVMVVSEMGRVARQYDIRR